MAKIKPIHKFNGGKGATLCVTCNKIITEGLTEDLYCEEHGGGHKYKYKLQRADGVTHQGDVAYWVEWDKNNRGKKAHKIPKIGRSFVLDFKYGTYAWLTTQVTEIVTKKKNYIKFKTKNSTYELFINF